MNKTKGQFAQIAKSERLAFNSVAGWQSGLMRLIYNRVNLLDLGSVRSNRTPAATINFAPSVVVATSGAILWPKPKDEVSTPIVILARLPEESKGENDVPQLRNRNGEGWKIWEEKDSEIPMQEMRQAIQ